MRFGNLIARAVVPLFLASTPVRADDLPRFDVEEHCDRVARAGGSFSSVIKAGCFEMEQVAYDTLKIQWPTLTASIRDHCTQVAAAGGSDSYAIFEGCVEMERQATDSLENRAFRY